MREKLRIDQGWKFFIGDPKVQKPFGHQDVYMASKTERGRGLAARDFYDGDWEDVTLPHDYVIAGDYDESEHGCHGYLKRENAWYRRTFNTLEEDKNKRITLMFDGIVTHSNVWVNGHLMERNFCGYTSFVMDVTDVLKPVGESNVIAVKVDLSEFEGWWYEGGGINRHVWMVKTENVAIAPFGTFVKPEIIDNTCNWLVDIEARVKNSAFTNEEVIVSHDILDEDNQVIVSVEDQLNLDYQVEVTSKTSVEVDNPAIWDLDTPHMYKVITTVYVFEGDSKVVSDIYETAFGFRTIRFDPNTGFYLNEENMKVKGVCIHFDHGGLGSAIPDQVLELRIKKLKDMGCNSFRCGHTPPAPEFLDLCDRYGMLVMDESRWFESSRDGLEQAKNMIIRDRNHPSVFIWSVGNEEPLQSTEVGANIATHLKGLVKSLDRTRPVTVALNGGYYDQQVTKASEIVGINYQYSVYDDVHKLLPDHPICSPEVGATSNTRSIYKNDPENGRYLAYDEIAASFGSTHRKAWMEVDIRDFVFGMYVWTGYEYRGESTWPKLFAGGGALDSSGYEKDNYHLFRALWTQEPMVHILPHWNLDVAEGEMVKVMTYTNAYEVELFLNGVSLGRKVNDKYMQTQWSVPYDKGVLKAVAYTNDTEVATDEKHTLEGPYHIEVVKCDTGNISADQSVLVYDVSIRDSEGRLATHLDDQMEFSLKGMDLIGTGNGDCADHDHNQVPKRRIFKGLCQVVTRVNANEDELIIQVTSQSFGEAECKLTNNFDFVKSLEVTDREWTIDLWWKSRPETEAIDPETAINVHDVNTWEPIHLSAKSFDDKQDFRQYYVKTKMPSFDDDQMVASLELKDIKGDVTFKVSHNPNYWPLPRPKEFLSIVKTFNEDIDSETIVLEGFGKDESILVQIITNNNKVSKSGLNSVNWHINPKK